MFLTLEICVRLSLMFGGVSSWFRMQNQASKVIEAALGHQDRCLKTFSP